MIKFILSLGVLLYASNAAAQTKQALIIKSSKDSAVLAGTTVSLKNAARRFVSDSAGNVLLNDIPAAKQTLIISNIGYGEHEQTFIPDSTKTLTVYLATEEEDMEEVVVSSTRTSRTIKNTPTRVETIEPEEIEEKINMRPANVAMLLHESTGIQVQQTSATSANASIRIQGLDGRYTQLLKDGYPGFGNFAGGLSVLEIPPLDLKQVEIIKGPASTLYGAGAIAGVVNFISKTPKPEGNYDFIINQSNIGQFNIGGFTAKRSGKIGYTLLALYNKQKLYDVDDDGFTELPESNDFTIHPKLFFYPSEKTTFIIGNSFTSGKRTGGDVDVIKGYTGADHTYFEENTTVRNTSTLDFTHVFSAQDKLTAKVAYAYFRRGINMYNYAFKGANRNFFSDVSYIKNLPNQTLIFGGNFISDRFKEEFKNTVLLRDFTTTTGGVYAQHTWDATAKLKLESGMRIDLVHYKNGSYSKTEVLPLPRISALYRFSSAWSSRVGGGLGYKSPTVFTEQTETMQFQNVLPLNNVKSERSYGGTADVNYTAALTRDLSFSLNQMFFLTQINHALSLTDDIAGDYFFRNETKPVVSKGFETNLKLIFRKNLKLFAGYTFTDAKAKYFSGNQYLTLITKNKVNLALVYEKEKDFKIGLEGYYTDKQYLGNGTTTPFFWEFGAAAEKTFKKITLFVNAENFTDTRQSRYKSVANPPHNAPSFDEIWTHTEGFVFNGGIKLKL